MASSGSSTAVPCTDVLPKAILHPSSPGRFMVVQDSGLPGPALPTLGQLAPPWLLTPLLPIHSRASWDLEVALPVGRAQPLARSG